MQDWPAQMEAPFYMARETQTDLFPWDFRQHASMVRARRVLKMQKDTEIWMERLARMVLAIFAGLRQWQLYWWSGLSTRH